MFGYCVAPLNIAALVSVFVPLIYVRLPVTFAAWAWCIWGMSYYAIVSTLMQRLIPPLASVNFLDGTKLEKQRTMLAVYPLLYVAFPTCNVFDNY